MTLSREWADKVEQGVHRSHVKGCLDARWPDFPELPLVSSPVDVGDEELFPNIAEAVRASRLSPTALSSLRDGALRSPPSGLQSTDAGEYHD